jgi:hypothetical protein
MAPVALDMPLYGMKITWMNMMRMSYKINELEVGKFRVSTNLNIIYDNEGWDIDGNHVDVLFHDGDKEKTVRYPMQHMFIDEIIAIKRKEIANAVQNNRSRNPD